MRNPSELLATSVRVNRKAKLVLFDEDGNIHDVTPALLNEMGWRHFDQMYDSTKQLLDLIFGPEDGDDVKSDNQRNLLRHFIEYITHYETDIYATMTDDEPDEPLSFRQAFNIDYPIKLKTNG